MGEAKNPGKYRIIVDTTGPSTQEGLDRLIQRIGWHIRNGVPGLINEADGGTASINEIADGPPEDTSEVRRHFRYHMPGIEGWQYHRSYKVAERGTDIQFQRTWKSDWEDLQ